MSALTPDNLIGTLNPKMTIPGLKVPRRIVEDGTRRTDWLPAEELPPRPYQLIDIAYHSLPKGVWDGVEHRRSMNAEYTGAGKKLIAVGTCLKLFALGKLDSVLVISLGVDVSQWIDDLRNHTEDLHIQEYRGTVKERERMRGGDTPDFRVCSYHTATADALSLLGAHDGVILDEVSYLKNVDTNAHRHIRLLCAPDAVEQTAHVRHIWDKNEEKLMERKKSHYLRPYPGTYINERPPTMVLPLSATPVETSPVDIFSLLFIMLGRRSPLGTSIEKFKQEWCVVTRNTAMIRTRSGGCAGVTIEKVRGVKKHRVDDLRKAIRPWFIRHPWDQVAPFMPEFEVRPDWIELTAPQRRKYQELSKGSLLVDFVRSDTGKEVNDREISAAVKMFYQLRTCDGLTSLPNQNGKESSKLSRCLWWLQGELSGEKVIVFSRFHQPLDDLEVKLGQEGIRFTRIDGNREDEVNEQARKDFWDPDGPRILLMTGKGSYALNLQCARYMILFNTIFNPKKLIQLYGRIRRPGAFNACVAIHLCCKDTAEEAQWTLLRDRETMSDDMDLGEDENFFATLTPEEQEKIVSHGLGGP